MATCNNEVEYFVDTGIDYKPVLTQCGYTNPYGRLAICDDCNSAVLIWQVQVFIQLNNQFNFFSRLI